MLLEAEEHNLSVLAKILTLLLPGIMKKMEKECNECMNLATKNKQTKKDEWAEQRKHQLASSCRG